MAHIKWTGWQYVCEDCKRTCRISEETMNELRKEHKADGITEPRELAACLVVCGECAGESGQEREAYTDTQDRESYTADDEDDA